MTALLWIAWSILALGGALTFVGLLSQFGLPTRQRRTGQLTVAVLLNLFVVTVFFLELINR